MAQYTVSVLNNQALLQWLHDNGVSSSWSGVGGITVHLLNTKQTLAVGDTIKVISGAVSITKAV